MSAVSDMIARGRKGVVAANRMLVIPVNQGAA
jgi:hypothetical protein